MHHPVLAHQTGLLKPPSARASMLGWGISLVVHALAVAWLLHAWQPHRGDTDAEPARRMEVRLVPIAPPAHAHAPAPAPSRTALHVAPARTPAAHGPAMPGRPPRLTATSPAPAATDQEAPADTASVTAADAGASAPTVDLAAARATARLLARESGKGLVLLPGRKPVVDANADHQVIDRLERARRVDCQTARAGSTNLLANVVLLAVDIAKNAADDSGCKW